MPPTCKLRAEGAFGRLLRQPFSLPCQRSLRRCWPSHRRAHRAHHIVRSLVGIERGWLRHADLGVDFFAQARGDVGNIAGEHRLTDQHNLASLPTRLEVALDFGHESPGLGGDLFGRRCRACLGLDIFADNC